MVYKTFIQGIMTVRTLLLIARFKITTIKMITDSIMCYNILSISRLADCVTSRRIRVCSTRADRTVHVLFVASLSAVIYQLLFVFLPVASTSIHLFFSNSFLFCFICFVRLFSVWLFSVFSVLLLEMYSRYFHLILPSTIRQVHKHHTPDCAIFYLCIGSKGLLQS